MKIIKRKQQEELIKRIATNYLIAKESLLRNTTLSREDFNIAVKNITDNAIECAKIIGGLNGVKHINEIVDKNIIWRKL